MLEGDELFESAAADLEKSLTQETPAADASPEDRFVSEVQKAISSLQKGKGAMPVATTADAARRGTLVDSGKDPAETPKKSGQGYDVPKNASYEARKGDDEDDEEEDDEPSFFKKKKKGAKKHSSSGKKHSSSGKKHSSSGMTKGDDDEDDDELAEDATEFMESLGEAVDHLGKSTRRLEEGLACFGELLTEMADPRRDKMLVAMAKAISHVVSEQKELNKSFAQSNQLMKAISQIPGAPRVAGMQAVVAAGGESVETETGARPSAKLTKSQRDQLFNLRVKRLVDEETVKKAVADDKVNELIASFKK